MIIISENFHQEKRSDLSGFIIITDPFSRTSLELREAKVPIVNFTTCTGIESDYKDFLSQDKHMCAGDIESAHIADSCEVSSWT